jgi:hypothetical protein
MEQTTMTMPEIMAAQAAGREFMVAASSVISVGPIRFNGSDYVCNFLRNGYTCGALRGDETTNISVTEKS